MLFLRQKGDGLDVKLNAIHLDDNSYVALHIQLHNALRQQIISGRWQNGDRIPSETQLAQHLQISRTTVRIALQRAEVENLITRVAGRGTFVSYDADSRAETRFVGFVTRSFHNEIHRTLLSSVETELRSEGYSLVFSKASNNADEVDVLTQLLNDNVRGVILWANARTTQAQRDVLRLYAARGIPVVYIDRLVDNVESDYVGSDNYGGTYALVRHLIELDHRHIAYLSHNIASLYPIQERFRGYQEAMRDFELASSEIWTIHSPNSSEFFETDLFELLEQQIPHFNNQIQELIHRATPRPTAIVCANDALAIMTMRAARDMGIRVPDELSIVGFDDLSLAAYLDTPLTTASQDAHGIGLLAAKTLLERLDGVSGPVQHHLVPTKLQIRMSTTTPIEVNQRKNSEMGGDSSKDRKGHLPQH
jgi:GntR family transcriptional regulator of arabinose operon